MEKTDPSFWIAAFAEPLTLFYIVSITKSEFACFIFDVLTQSEFNSKHLIKKHSNGNLDSKRLTYFY